MLSGAVPWPDEVCRRYRRDGYWTGHTFAELLRTPAVNNARGPALVDGARRVGYAELDRLADRLAAGLRARGIGVGDRMVVQLPNSVELVALLVAAFRAGVVPVLALAAHRRAEIGYLCEHAEASVLVIPDRHLGFDHRELARQVRAGVSGLREVLVVGEPAEFTALAEVDAEPAGFAAPDPGEVALCLLSGGTTGRPKLIARTHDDYLCQVTRTADEVGLDHRGGYLAALPMTHNAALGCPGVLGALWVGARVVLAASPAPDEVFPLIAREGVTLTTLMPAFLPVWAATVDLFDVDLSGLVIEVGGAKLSQAAAVAAERALGATVTRWFGMGEGPLSFTRPGDPADVRLGTEGRPLNPADEFRVVDEQGGAVADGQLGELLVRGPCTPRGYYRAADDNHRLFTPDGFLRTGDLVRRTAEGHLVVEGRLRDVVNRGGEKIPAEEVEEHLRAHPKVKDVALVAVDDDSLGERAAAVVVPVGAAPSLPELTAFLLDRGLAGFKVPERLRVVDHLPYTPVGKVDKRALRALLSGRGPAR